MPEYPPVHPGMRFGNLTVIQSAPPYRDGNDVGYPRWECICTCGSNKIVRQACLRSGHTRSCGCLVGIAASLGNRKHGDVASGIIQPEYRSWQMMIERCTNPKCKHYGSYGGRGISICSRWRNSYANFLQDMGRRPSQRHSLDRYPDNNGNYEPDNCRWATHKEQARNRRSNVILKYHGREMCVSAWADDLGVSDKLIRDRIRAKWSIERALESPRGAPRIRAKRQEGLSRG